MKIIHAPGGVVGLLAECWLSYDGVFVWYAVLVGALTVGMGVLAWRGRLPSGT